MLKAKDIMTKDVITVKPNVTIEELARIFIKHQISGIPVVDDNGNLKGIVTDNDLISQNRKLHIPTILRMFDAFIPLGTSKLENEIKKMAASTVQEIYKKDVITVNEDASFENIATIMSEKNIHHLPVIRDRKLIGIIGKKDLIKNIAEETS
jgi:CBS domain-containing protein